MQLLYDLFPVIIFFAAFKLAGVYVATASAMVASLLQVTIYRIRHHRFEKMQVITLLMIVILGGATLFLHNPIFIKWKPTVINWIFALAFLASHFVSKKPLIRHIMEQKVQLPDRVWNQLNWSWIYFFAAMGAANLYVVYHYSTNAWVNFKLFGLLGLTLIFVFLQAIFLSKHIQQTPEVTK